MSHNGIVKQAGWFEGIPIGSASLQQGGGGGGAARPFVKVNSLAQQIIKLKTRLPGGVFF